MQRYYVKLSRHLTPIQICEKILSAYGDDVKGDYDSSPAIYGNPMSEDSIVGVNILKDNEPVFTVLFAELNPKHYRSQGCNGVFVDEVVVENNNLDEELLLDAVAKLGDEKIEERNLVEKIYRLRFFSDSFNDSYI